MSSVRIFFSFVCLTPLFVCGAERIPKTIHPCINHPEAVRKQLDAYRALLLNEITVLAQRRAATGLTERPAVIAWINKLNAELKALDTRARGARKKLDSASKALTAYKDTFDFREKQALYLQDCCPSISEDCIETHRMPSKLPPMEPCEPLAGEVEHDTQELLPAPSCWKKFLHLLGRR